MKPSVARILCALTFLTASTLTFTVAAEAANPIAVVYALQGQPAYFPAAGLVADSAGNMYGTTLLSKGSCVYCGTVFKLAPKAGGGWNFILLHEFSGPDGYQPAASLILDASGNLYGTTTMDGAYGLGTVFEVYQTRSGWQEKVLYSFGPSSEDLQSPYGSLTMDATGNLYGTAANGGNPS